MLDVGCGPASITKGLGAVGVDLDPGPAEGVALVRGDGCRLPFADATFDAAMTTFSVHQWPDLAAGLAELRRVTLGPVCVLTGDPALLRRFWLTAYAPEVIDTEARRYPTVERLTAALPGTTTVRPVPIPLDCVDGFNEAYYGRPEALLDPDARRVNSAWSFVGPAVHDRFAADLRRDLDDGTWDRHHGHLRTQPTFEGSLVLIVNTPG